MSQYVGRNCPKAFSLVLSVDCRPYGSSTTTTAWTIYVVYVLALYGKILRNVQVDLGLYLNYGLSFKISDLKEKEDIYFFYLAYTWVYFTKCHILATEWVRFKQGI